MNNYNYLANHRKSNLHQRMLLYGLSILAFGFGAMNLKGCNDSINGKENPFGIASKIGYDIGQEIGTKESGLAKKLRVDESKIVFPGKE